MTEEEQEYPILCETCLGPNPLVRMTKETQGKACEICERPFTVFRWKPGGDARYKKTEICRTCARLKNVCQTCILDLQFGLPVQVRDSLMPKDEIINLPHDPTNRGLAIERYESQLAQQPEVGAGSLVSGYQKSTTSSTLQRLARRTPFYERNKAHYCSFFARGECNRGTLCPFRHELAPTGDLSKQNLKDRFAGINDPVAQKMMNSAKKIPQKSMSNTNITAPPPPEDRSITTLWVGGVSETSSEDDLRDIFEAYGEIRSLNALREKRCAFVTYKLRVAAEEAVKRLFDNCTLNGDRLKLNWSKPKSSSAT